MREGSLGCTLLPRHDLHGMLTYHASVKGDVEYLELKNSSIIVYRDEIR